MTKFNEKHCDNAKDFIDCFRLSDEFWASFVGEGPKPSWKRDFIFRGEGSVVKWKSLMAKAWRKDEITFDKDNSQLDKAIDEALVDRLSHEFNFAGDMGAMKEVIYQNRAELVLVKQFESLANELGFRITSLPIWTIHTKAISKLVEFVFPIDTSTESLPKYSHYVLSESDKGAIIWGNPIIALAQHHGIATRLLDWTYNPLAAIYFAATSAKLSENNDFIVVYAASLQQFWESHIKVIEVPTADNPYLQAQSGIFTLDTKADEYRVKHGDYPSFADSIDGLPGPAMMKITLPVTEVPELLRLLWIEGVSQAHLMPTLDNVAKTVIKNNKVSKIINHERQRNNKSPVKNWFMGE